MKLALVPYSDHHLEDCLKLFNSNQGKYFSADEEHEYRSFLTGLSAHNHYFVVSGNDRIVAAGGIAVDAEHAVLTWGMVANDLHGYGIGDYLTRERLKQIATYYPGNKIRIETSQHTAGFYMRYGFQISLKQPDGYARNIDKIIMLCDPTVISKKQVSQSFQTNLILEGNTLLLEPLLSNDFDRLFKVASDPHIWAMHPASDRYKKEIFQGYFTSGLESGMAFIIKDKETSHVIGSSRYNAPDYQASSVEIGWTFLARSHWGGKCNSELKHLMIWHAFATFAKIHFCIGATNYRSIAAVKKLGAYHQPDILDEARPDSVIYELTPDTYVGQGNYGNSHRLA